MPDNQEQTGLIGPPINRTAVAMIMVKTGLVAQIPYGRRIALMIAIVLLIGGCSFKAYLGLRGPSIQLYPEVHDAGMTDADCLDCHDPKAPAAPPTRHSGLGRCLECHSDPVEAESWFRETHESILEPLAAVLGFRGSRNAGSFRLRVKRGG